MNLHLVRLDGAPPPPTPVPFVELLVTTPFSFGHGASHSWELALTAHQQRSHAIGCADRNTLAGAVRMHLHGKEAGITPLIGCRLVLEDAPDIVAYPRDRAAYGRLTRLLSVGKNRLEGAKPTPGARVDGKCRLWLSDMAEHGEGMALIAVPGDDLDGFERALPELVAALPMLEYVAAAWRHDGSDRERINRLDAMARAHGLAILATADAHYHHPSRRPLHDVMRCIDHRTTLRNAGRLLHSNGERHLKGAGEMARLFGEWPHAIAATRAVADSIRFSLDELAYRYPDEPVPPGKTADEHLADLTWHGAQWRYPDGVPTSVRATLEEELRLIAKLGYAHYFLTVHDVVAWARERGILCQGRGSAANSAVCYCIGVTSVDPAKHSLLIARFISDKRGEPPDIDVDFEHERREEVIQYVYRRYGRHRAALAATVIHYRPRMAIREVGRVMGLSEDVTAAIAKTVWGSWGTEIAERHMREAGLDPNDPLLKRTVALASELIGMPRHLSQHVGGFVLTQNPLIETVPTLWGAMPDRTFIEWDKDDLDAVGLMKVDVLALGMLTCVAKSFAMLSNHKGIDATLATLPPEDPATYDMLCEGDSLGVFQVESRAQMAMLPRLRPRRFYDLVIEVAIVRPGPIQGDMVHPYLRRRERIEPVIYPFPSPEHGPPDELQAILGRTLGVPVFQEQAMQIAMDAAKFSDVEANELRKAMATFRSRGTISALQDKMVGRMIARGYDPEFARHCFEQIKGFGEYGFPESHAASFAHLVYVSSWIKCHHPDVFCAALLNSQPMGFYAPAQIVRDARAHGVEVLPPDVNRSDWDCTLEVVPPSTEADRCSEASRPPLRQPSAATSPSEGGGKPSPRTPSILDRRDWSSSLPPPSEGEVASRSDDEGGDAIAPLPQPPHHWYHGAPDRPRGSMSTATPRPWYGPAPRPPVRFAVRLGLRMVEGLEEAAAHRITAAREDGAFGGVRDARSRAELDRRAVRLLASADAFRSCGLSRRGALWDARAVRDAPDLPLFGGAATRGEASTGDAMPPPTPIPDEGPDIPHALPAMPESEEVVADYQTVRLTLRDHPMRFLREHYRAERVARPRRVATAAEIVAAGHGGRMGAAGLVLVRQRPGSAKGVCFLTIEDETGIVNVVVWPTVMEANRRTVMASRLLRVEGRVQTNDRVTHLVAERLVDDTHLLSRLSDADELASGLDHQLARADHVARPLPPHWQAPHDAGLPKARNVEESCRPNHDPFPDGLPSERPALARAPEPRRTHPRDAVIIPRAREFR